MRNSFAKISCCFFILFGGLQVFAQSWTKLETEAYRGKQDDIFFLAGTPHVWYVNGYGKIFHSSDHGKTFLQQIEKKGTFFRCIGFVDSLTGFAGTIGTDYFPGVTDTVPLYKTTDGGKSWNPVSYEGPVVKGLCAIQILKEQFINHGEITFRYHVYAVGRVGSPAMMMVSHDGGEHFRSSVPDSGASMLMDIHMLNIREGFLCASTSADMDKNHALILKTTDGGKVWREVYRSDRPFENTWKFSFPDEKIGYSTIQSYNPDTLVMTQRVVKTTDGGETWKELELLKNHKARPFGIGFTDALHGYVGTMISGYETKDGGLSWQPVDLGKACNKIRFQRNSKGIIQGYAIGVNVFRFEP
jgi:photosystem II stability/assembly factor-like uncharacterized protein